VDSAGSLADELAATRPEQTDSSSEKDRVERIVGCKLMIETISFKKKKLIGLRGLQVLEDTGKDIAT
jgi:hypothetical protein